MSGPAPSAGQGGGPARAPDAERPVGADRCPHHDARPRGRIIAIGTTSLRLPKAPPPSGKSRVFRRSAFILPGYQFRAIDLLLTNFIYRARRF
jgi:hypothetical protein